METIEELISQINSEKEKLSSLQILFSDKDEFVDIQNNLLDGLSCFSNSMDTVVGMLLDNRDYFQQVSKDIADKLLHPPHKMFPPGKGWLVWFRPIRHVDNGYCFANIPLTFDYHHRHNFYHKHILPFPPHRHFPPSGNLLTFLLNKDYFLDVFFKDELNEETSKIETFVLGWVLRGINGKYLLDQKKVSDVYSKIENYKPDYLQHENQKFWTERKGDCIYIGNKVAIVKTLFKDLLQKMLEDIQYTIAKTISPLTSDNKVEIVPEERNLTVDLIMKYLQSI